MPDTLNLVKIPVRASKLAQLARQRRLPLRELDDGYLCHCLLRELWQERAPAPFALRGQGHTIEAWGYTRSTAADLVEHAQAFADPSLLEMIENISAIASKTMPRLPTGKCVGFVLRACPVVRLAKASAGHRKGAEIDAYLARCFTNSTDVEVSREQVYRDWLTTRLGNTAGTGVTVSRLDVAGYSRERLTRRTQGEDRQPHSVERPDVHFEGDLIINDGERFLSCLAHGVGRHRAFGFGALLLVPPRTVSNS